VLHVLNRFCSERGITDRLFTDYGTCFTAHAFEEFCNERGIRHTLNSTRHPQANGQVERANRTVLTLLIVTTDNHCNWDTRLRYVENMLNTAPNKSTTKTPYETLHGYLSRFQKGILPTLSLTRNDWQDPHDIQADARRNIIDAQSTMKIYHDRKRSYIKYEVGEVVIMTRQPVPHLSSKLQPKYRVKPL
jgi:transposase InsO family protein